MRIISKFSDYYDCGIAYGIDPKIVYKRFTTHEDGPNARRIDYRGHRVMTPAGRTDVNVEKRWLYFCGKKYTLYHGTVFLGDVMIHESWVTTKKEVIAFYKKHGVKPPSNKYARVYNNIFGHARYENDIIEDHTINLQYNSPAVLEETKEVYTINPCLKDIGFSKIMDPYAAFQEISMYLAGPLTPWEDPDLKPEPDGVQKMINHGMDPIHGFRRR